MTLTQPPPVTLDTYIIADLHFGHKNVMKWEPIRQSFTTAGGHASHEDMLTHLWNDTVGPEDDVLVLGDLAFKGIPTFVGALNGNISIIRGNHDRPRATSYLNAGAKYVYDSLIIDRYDDTPAYAMIQEDSYISGLVWGPNIMFSHYPLEVYEEERAYERPAYSRGAINSRVKTLSTIAQSLGIGISIHGHTHSECPADTDTMRYINVSAEVLGFRPTKLRDLLKYKG